MKINYLMWQRFVSILLIILFSQPFLAELSFNNAKKEVMRLNIESAVKYFELARRLTPFNSNYYFEEANLWNLALQHGDNYKYSAERANKLYLKGLDANPFEVKNLLSRAVLHREFPQLLESPANKEEILDWFDYILYWRPSMEIAQYEYINTLNKFERKQEAELKLKEFLRANPNAELLLGLADTNAK